MPKRPMDPARSSSRRLHWPGDENDPTDDIGCSRKRLILSQSAGCRKRSSKSRCFGRGGSMAARQFCGTRVLLHLSAISRVSHQPCQPSAVSAISRGTIGHAYNASQLFVSWPVFVRQRRSPMRKPKRPGPMKAAQECRATNALRSAELDGGVTFRHPVRLLCQQSCREPPTCPGLSCCCGSCLAAVSPISSYFRCRPSGR